MSACITINFDPPPKKTKQTLNNVHQQFQNAWCAPYLSDFANHNSTTLTAYVLAKVQQMINIKMKILA